MFNDKLDLFKRLCEVVDMIDVSLVRGDMQLSILDLQSQVEEIREEISRWTTSTPMVSQKRIETIIIMINEFQNSYGLVMEVI